MKKTYLMLAAVAALFAACSSDNNDLAEKQTAKDQPQEVSFSAYVNRATTRAGLTGDLTDAQLQLATGGFGVFAYYTDGEPYSENSKPNFMYNQKVYYDTSSWKYSPYKYWPNEFGTTAESDGIDKLTFFAYAPYAEVKTSTGIVTGDASTGIVALTRNTAHGDPFVKYYASMAPAKRVDLCFGVSKSGLTGKVTDGPDNTITTGKPYIDVTKPAVASKIDFDFRHALAAVNVQIDADIDKTAHSTDAYLDGKTKIYVRSVTFEGFTNKGMLNLNSEATTADYTPNWYDLSGINTIGSGTVTIYDGRRDGREGQANSVASNELPNELNKSIISDDGNTTAGVPAVAPVNLFDVTGLSGTDAALLAAPIFVIPTTQALKVTIVYDVETEDENLPTYLSDGKTKGSSVRNTITKDIKVSTTPVVLAAGKAYTIKLHLGMNSVQFDASVTPWPAAVDGGEPWLPLN